MTNFSMFRGEMGGTAVQAIDIAVSVYVEYIIVAFSIGDILLRAAFQKHTSVKNVRSALRFAVSPCILIQQRNP